MLSSLHVQNFRSIEDAKVELRPITVLFGPTSSGKSSLFYSLLVLRNFVLNPNQPVDSFFSLGFLNLGGFEDCVFNHATSRTMLFSTAFADPQPSGTYAIELSKAEAEITAQAASLPLTARVPVPFALNQSWSFDHGSDGHEFTVNWNGFACSVTPKVPTPESQAAAPSLAAALNRPVEALKRIDICPHRRGFFKPSYTPSQLTATPTSDDEVATLIINDKNSPPRISIDTSEIFDRDFRIHTPPGTATVFLQTTEQSGARVPGLLVNDGFGVNQVVYLLAKIHRPDVETVLIEEPEVHLHPTVIRRLARVLARLATEEQKQLAFTTHSEQFLLSILACVKEQLIRHDQVACYLVTREGKRTTFTHQPVTAEGQISGGLSSFMEAELEDMKVFLTPGR